MMRMFVLSVGAWTALAGGASACRAPIAGPAQIMERDFVTVATARVLSVEPADAEQPERQFTASLLISETLEGAVQARRLTLRHRETTECPRRLPLPEPGEVWVVYREWEASDGGPVTYAWPLSWAERLDRRFRVRSDDQFVRPTSEPASR